jgi:hypothetical protein
MEGYGYSDAWKAIIRPPRDEYSEEELGILNYYPLHSHRTKTIYDWQENISTN